MGMGTERYGNEIITVKRARDNFILKFELTRISNGLGISDLQPNLSLNMLFGVQ